MASAPALTNLVVPWQTCSTSISFLYWGDPLLDTVWSRQYWLEGNTAQDSVDFLSFKDWLLASIQFTVPQLPTVSRLSYCKELFFPKCKAWNLTLLNFKGLVQSYMLSKWQPSILISPPSFGIICKLDEGTQPHLFPAIVKDTKWDDSLTEPYSTPLVCSLPARAQPTTTLIATHKGLSFDRHRLFSFVRPAQYYICKG